MNGTIGRCSICGGEVHGHVGPWHGVIPPPPGRCQSCGAVESRGPIIPMTPGPVQPSYPDGWPRFDVFTDTKEGRKDV